MDSIFECKTCAHKYDDNLHKPLSLPCGHVFCQECLSKQPKLFCPTDKSKFEQSFSSLPCCYTILASIPKTINKEGCCIRHPKKKVKFMCKSHDKFLCTECVVDHTGAGHNIVAFTVNSAVVKSDLKALELLCEGTLKECEDKKREIEFKSRYLKDFYSMQFDKINQSYEICLKNLQNKKKEMFGYLSKVMGEQVKGMDKGKDGINKTLEGMAKVMAKIRDINGALPHYETLSMNIKGLKQELKFFEVPEIGNTQFVALKNSEPFSLFCTSFEEVDGIEVEKRLKGYSSRYVLQASCLNEEKGKNVSGKNDKSGTENKSPDKEHKKCRQNYHARNHPKRMPWRKRTRSY